MDAKEEVWRQWLTNIDQQKRDAKALHALLQDLLDRVDSVNEATNKTFALHFLPKLEELLTELPVQLEETYINASRNLILRLLQKVSSRPIPPEIAQRIYHLLFITVDKENEENAVFCLQMLYDILRKNMQTFDAATFDQFESYLLRQFQTFGAKFSASFGTPEEAPSESSRRPQRNIKQLSKDSFKLVYEACGFVMNAMGIAAKRPKQKLVQFLPEMVKALELMPSKELQTRKKEQFNNMLNAQCRIYMLIEYLLRASFEPTLLKSYAKNVAEASVTFLRNCSSEQVGIRKSMLNSLRYLIKLYIDAYTDLATQILDYELLLGEDSERPDLRTEASMIVLIFAEVCCNKSGFEKKEQMVRSVMRTMNDCTISVGLQTSAVSLLAGYIETISHMPECVMSCASQLQIRILMEIAETLAMKFKYISRSLPRAYARKCSQKAVDDKRRLEEDHTLSAILSAKTRTEEKREESAEKSDKERGLEFYVDTGRNSLRIDNDQDRDVPELFREAQLLAQKTVELAYRTIRGINGACRMVPGEPQPQFGSQNTPYCCAERKSFEQRIDILTDLFHAGVRYFVTMNALVRFHGKDAADPEDLEKDVRRFVDSFYQLDQRVFSAVLEKQIGFLCKCITDPEAVIKRKGIKINEARPPNNGFLQRMFRQVMEDLTTKEKAKLEVAIKYGNILADILARHILKKFVHVGGYKKTDPGQLPEQPSMAKLQRCIKMLELFKLLMEMFGLLDTATQQLTAASAPASGEAGTMATARMREDFRNSGIYGFYFSCIVLSAKYSHKARVFRNYFAAIKTVCKAIKGRSTEPPKEFSMLVPGILTMALRVKQDFVLLYELVTEICQYLPLSARSLVEYLPLLMRPFMDSIFLSRVNSPIVAVSIKNFEQYPNQLGQYPELLDPLYAPILQEYVLALHRLFNCQNYTYCIHRMTARLGGKARLYTTEKEVVPKSFPEEGLRMLTFERTTHKKLVVGVDVVLDAAYRYMETEDRYKPGNMDVIYKLVKATYLALMDASFDADYVKDCYASLLTRNYPELKLKLSCKVQFNSARGQPRLSSMRRENQRHGLEKLLTTLFYMTTICASREGLSSKIPAFFEFVCQHLVVIGLCRNGTLTTGRLDEIDPMVYLDIISGFLGVKQDPAYSGMEDGQVSAVSIRAIRRIATMYREIFADDPRALSKIQLLDLVLRRICDVSYWKDWHSKEGSALAISVLLGILPADFFKKYELLILRTMLNALNTLPETAAIATYNVCANTLHSLVKKCHSPSSFVLSKSGVFSPSPELVEYMKNYTHGGYVAEFKEICRELVRALQSERRQTRQVAREVLRLLSEAEKVPLEELLKADTATYEGEVIEEGCSPELLKLKEDLLDRGWTEHFSSYEYAEICAGLDCLKYLLEQDKGGNILTFESKILDTNEELLEIITGEISSHEATLKETSEGSIRSFYLRREKMHHYHHPIYEASISSVYNYPIKSEQERAKDLENRKRLRQEHAQFRAARLDKLLRLPGSETETRIIGFTRQFLMGKEGPAMRSAITPADRHIYNVFPRSKARLKAVVTTTKTLCAEFLKLDADPAWTRGAPEASSVLAEQKLKFLVTLLRLLARDEKCLHKTAKRCIKAMYGGEKSFAELAKSKVYIECIRMFISTTKLTDLVGCQKLMHVVKLFPESFKDQFWGMIIAHIESISTKLAEDFAHRSESSRASIPATGIKVLCNMLSCFAFRAKQGEDLRFLKSMFAKVQKLRDLLQAYGLFEAILYSPLAKLFSNYTRELVSLLEEQHAAESADPKAEKRLESTLHLLGSVVQARTAGKLCVALKDCVQSALVKILNSCREREDKNYAVLHEILRLFRGLKKSLKSKKCKLSAAAPFAEWLKSQGDLIRTMAAVWLSFIPDSGYGEKGMQPLMARLLRNDLQKIEKLLVEYMRERPDDVKTAYLSLELLKNLEYTPGLELKHFFCYELPAKVPESVYRNYIEMYISFLSCDNIDEKPCLNATGYLMIPLLFHIYHEKPKDVLARDLEEKLLAEIFHQRPWKTAFQRRILRLGVLVLEHAQPDRMDASKKNAVLDIWKKTKSEDQAVKAWGFMAMAKFAGKVKMPNERIQETVYSFMGETPVEHREVVYEAIDDVIPLMFRTSTSQQQEQSLKALCRTIRMHVGSIQTLMSAFRMVVRNEKIFRPYKLILYPQMYNALQKLFWSSPILQSKLIALDIAKVILSWSLDPSSDPRTAGVEKQLKDTIATLLLKELCQPHMLLAMEEHQPKECLEATYKALAMLRNVLIRHPEFQLKSSVWDKPAPPTSGKVLEQSLNTMCLVLKFYRAGKLEDYGKKFTEMAQTALYYKDRERKDISVPQKNPFVLEALCRFCSFLKLKSAEYPADWVAEAKKAIGADLELSFAEMRSFAQTVKSLTDADKAGVQVRPIIKKLQKQLHFMIPHLSIRLCSTHAELALASVFQDQFEPLFKCWSTICRAYVAYIKHSERHQVFPYPKGGAATSPSPDLEWEWLSSNDPDIVLMGSVVPRLDHYIRDAVLRLTLLFADYVVEFPKYAEKYFEVLIDSFEKDCNDETTLLGIVQAARKVIMSKAQLSINSNRRSGNPFLGVRSELVVRLLEVLQPENDQASNAVLELAHEYLSSLVELKEHHRRMLSQVLSLLRNKSPTIRDKLYSFFDRYYGKSVYDRLQYIFRQQWSYNFRDQKDWCWVQPALDLLLSTVDGDERLQREVENVAIIRFPRTKEDVLMADESKLEEIIGKNQEVCMKLRRKNARYLLDPLKVVTNWDNYMCEKLWLRLFPQFWNVMSADEQQQIACLIEPFLAKEDLLRPSPGKGPSTIRTLFEAVAACSPVPKIAPEVAQYVSRKNGAWHTAIPLLESYLYAFPGIERFAICLGTLFSKLNEPDYAIGVRRYVSRSPVTRAGLAYLQFNMWQAAYDLFASAIAKRVVLEEDKGKDSAGVLEDTVTYTDLRVWEDGMIESATQLNQWDVVGPLAQETNRLPVLADYYWATQNWEEYTTVSKKLGEGESATAILARHYLGIQRHGNGDPKWPDIDKAEYKAVYNHWIMLPNVVDAPHYASLGMQQLFLECSEFKTMYKTLRDYLLKPQEGEYKSNLSIWRDRLPHKSESFAVWRNLLETRNFLFTQLTSKLSEGNPAMERLEPYVQDIPWNCLKLAEVARKHGLTDQALKYLEQAEKAMKEPSGSDVYNYEHFFLVKETAKLAMQSGFEWKEATKYLKAAEAKGFCKKLPLAMSEIQRMSGELFHREKILGDASDALKNATGTCVHNYKAWAAFARFNEDLYETMRKPLLHVNALKGYLQATTYMLGKAKLFIPKIFACLERDSSQPTQSPRTAAPVGALPLSGDSATEGGTSPVLKCFLEYSASLPVWTWIYWIPQLLSGLTQGPTEREACRAILRNIGKLYPQPLFVQLSRTEGADGFERELVRDMKEQHGQKLDEVGRILTELEQRVLPGPGKEEELVLALKQVYAKGFPVPDAKKTAAEIQKIGLAYFDPAKEEYRELQQMYGEQFRSDFVLIQESNAVALLLRVRNWIDHLVTKAMLRTEQYSLVSLSQELANMIPKGTEMFGCNYTKDAEPAAESLIYVSRINPKVERTHLRTRVELRGTNEKLCSYCLDYGQSPENERRQGFVAQLRDFLSQLFMSHRMTMARNVKLYTPYSLCWGKMKLTLSPPSYIQMSELHDTALIERGFHPDYATISYLERYGKEAEGKEGGPQRIKTGVVEEMRTIMGDYVFAAFVHRFINTPDELFIYRKQFTNYMAGQAFFSYTFGMSHPDLSSFVFCKRTGKLFYSSYAVDTQEAAAPFRLTPNLQYFVSPVGVQGPFAGGVTAAALSVKKCKLCYLAAYLRLFYRGAQLPDCSERVLNKMFTLVDTDSADKLFASRHGETARTASDEQVCFNQKVYDKIKEATDEKRLNEMSLEWAPWFQLLTEWDDYAYTLLCYKYAVSV